MTNETADGAMRRACDYLVAGDYMSVLGDLTPEAMAEAMTLGSGITAMPMPTAYVIESEDEVQGEHRFRVRFTTNRGDVTARATWRQFDGAWKITTLGIDALPQ